MSINVLSSEQTWIMDGLFRLAEGRIWLVKEAMEYASSDPTRDPLPEEVVEYILKKVERLRAKEGRKGLSVVHSGCRGGETGRRAGLKIR